MLAAAALISGFFLPLPVVLNHVLLAIACTLAIVTFGHEIWRALRIYGFQRGIQHFSVFLDHDVSPSFLTGADGRILTRNPTAESRFTSLGETLAGCLRSIFANPGAILFRLQSRAVQDESASEDIVTRQGHVRLAVHRLSPGLFLWRVQDIPALPSGRSSDRLPIPMVTIARSGTVLFMNDAARALVGDRVKSFTALFGVESIRSGEAATLHTKSGKRSVLIHQNELMAGRREVFFLPFEGAAVSDQTRFMDPPVPMLRVNPDGRILAATPQAVRLLGAGSEPGVSLTQVMEGLGRPIQDWLNETISGKAVQKSEFLRLKNDQEMFVQVTLSRVQHKGEVQLVAVLNDATELKTLEAQFVQSQKMQAIGQLAGGVAHDFNNLLTAITGHCDLLLLRHDQGDQDFGDLTQINENANRAAALVGQLLAFSRKQTLRPEPLDLRDTLADLTHLLNRLVGEKISLTLAHDPVLKPIRADKRQVEQVLMNLVVNARDAMPTGGEIRVQTEVVDIDAPLERDRATVPAGEYVTVKVLDEGVGIEADKIQKVFEPFFTTKRTGEGTGLGLSTAYGIVKQSGGFIFVDSIKGNGTQFTLFFPVHTQARPQQTPVAKPKAQTAPSQGDGVVLLVEDEAPVRAFASRALRLRGYTVLEAECGEDALATLTDTALEVDVIVTDVVMPGLDGPTWVRRALKQRPDVKVVFVSGYAEGAFGDTQPQIPNSVFLPKPFSLNQLTETVYEQLP
ncbi:MAG: ATP-binding protein [Paracoccaceae bacterium]